MSCTRVFDMWLPHELPAPVWYPHEISCPSHTPAWDFFWKVEHCKYLTCHAPLCSVLLFVVVCCSALQCVAVCNHQFLMCQIPLWTTKLKSQLYSYFMCPSLLWKTKFKSQPCTKETCKRDLILTVFLRKQICNLRHPMHLCHPVIHIANPSLIQSLQKSAQ